MHTTEKLFCSSSLLTQYSQAGVCVCAPLRYVCATVRCYKSCLHIFCIFNLPASAGAIAALLYALCTYAYIHTYVCMCASLYNRNACFLGASPAGTHFSKLFCKLLQFGVLQWPSIMLQTLTNSQTHTHTHSQFLRPLFRFL